MIAQQKITVFANGQAKQIDGATTLGALATSFNLPHQMVLVELNGTALLRDEWPDKVLSHGDRVEFIKVVAGG